MANILKKAIKNNSCIDVDINLNYNISANSPTFKFFPGNILNLNDRNKNFSHSTAKLFRFNDECLLEPNETISIGKVIYGNPRFINNISIFNNKGEHLDLTIKRDNSLASLRFNDKNENYINLLDKFNEIPRLIEEKEELRSKIYDETRSVTKLNELLEEEKANLIVGNVYLINYEGSRFVSVYIDKINDKLLFGFPISIRDDDRWWCYMNNLLIPNRIYEIIKPSEDLSKAYLNLFGLVMNNQFNMLAYSLNQLGPNLDAESAIELAGYMGGKSKKRGRKRKLKRRKTRKHKHKYI